MRLALMIAMLLLGSQALPQADLRWNAPDRGAKVAELAPGRQMPHLTPDNLFADYTKQQMALWAKDHPALPEAEAYAKYAATAPTDAELTADFPRHIVPFARVRSGSPAAGKAEAALNTYCPLCGSWGFGLTYEPGQWYVTTTNCCKTKLYGREQDMPADYSLRPTEKIKFQHLDDTMYEDSCTVFRDKDGVEWELFIRTMMDYRRWLQEDCDLVRRLAQQFDQTGDPCAVHKIAVILDQVADTYYGLPLAASNTLATYQGKPLTRAAWQSVPQPGIFQLTPLGSWGRRIPFSSPGWLNMLDEHVWVEPFGRVRHHPAFKAVSQKLYGDPEALDRKIMSKLLGDLVLMFKTAFSQKLLTNYQEANYCDLWLLGLLAQDATLIDFAGPAQEVAMYNHSYQDGLNGEGAPNYMAMPGGYFYPFLADPKGWLEFYPRFLEDHPFYHAANGELRRLTTVRGLQVEFGDQHEQAFAGNMTVDPAAVREQERIGSRNWAGYGVGIMRLGGPGHRQELCLDYTRATLHNAQDALSLECWVDGVPVLRKGGYAAYWHNVHLQWDRPAFQALKQMGYPKEIAEGGRPPDNWSWNYAHSPLCQNNLTVDDVGPGAGWGDNRGYGEVITFKGGEAAGEPGSGFQVLEVRDHYTWSRKDKQISEFRRALIGVEGPDGRPYVLDLTKISGAQRHTLYNSAVADRAEANLPAAVGADADLTQTFYGGKLPENDSDAPNLKRVTKVERLGPAGATWDVTWRKDAAELAPRDPGGKPFKRPLPDDVGRVRLRMIGLSQSDGQTQLISGKGPWIGMLHQSLPGGVRAEGNVAFLEARDFLIERRVAKPGQTATSLFAHILEGFREGEQSCVKTVTPLQVMSLAGPERDTLALRLQMAGGHTDTVIYQSEAGKLKLPDGTETDARYALLRQDKAGKMIGSEVCRGTYLRVGSFGVNLPGDFTGEIVDVIGDLTGTRQETALIIKPDKPWPVASLPSPSAGGQGAAVVGPLHDRQLLVRYESELRDPGNEGWRIDKATALPGGLVRVDMQDHAPFIVSWHQVTVLPEDRPNVVRSWRPVVDHGDNPWCWGLKLWFPTRSKLYTIKQVNEVGGGYGGDTIELAGNVNLAADGIKVGDWYVIYGIEPGLQVCVANDFSFRQEPAEGWTQYSATGTGAFTLKSPATSGPVCVSTGGDWTLAAQGKSTFTAAETQRGPVRLLVGKPAWLNLNDKDAPGATVTLDGKQIPLAETPKLGWIEAPKGLVVSFTDAANPLDVAGVSVTLNGNPVAAALVKSTPGEQGRSLRVEVDLQRALAAETAVRKHTVLVGVSDKSVERHRTVVQVGFMVRQPQEADAIYLSDLKPVSSFAHGGLIRDTDYVGNPAQIGEVSYPKCLMLHPEPSPQGEHAEVVYQLPTDKGALVLKSDLGVSTSSNGAGSVEFLVQVGDTPQGEWQTLYTSPVVRGGQEAQVLELPLQGAKYVRLYVTSAGDGIGSDHALWGGARLVAGR